jgi:hypothetical protein
MKKIKSYLIMAAILSTMQVNANANGNKNIKVTANVNRGCSVSANDIHFGSNIFLIKKVVNTLVINCSKGTSLNLALIGQTNPDGYRLTFMTIGGKKMSASGPVDRDFSEGIQYSSQIQNIPSENSTFIITRRPLDDVLGSLTLTGFNHTMDLKITSSEPAVLNINNYITKNNQLMRLIPGDYFDNLTYKVTF